MITFVKKTKNSEDLHIPVTAADICRNLANDTNSVYKNLPCPLINRIFDKVYVYVSLYDIIEYAFLDTKHLPDLLLLLPTPHGKTPCEKELLSGFIEINKVQ